MSDDSDLDDVAHQKLLQSIHTPGTVKKNRLKKASKTKTDATSLLSHLTVSRYLKNKFFFKFRIFAILQTFNQQSQAKSRNWWPRVDRKNRKEAKIGSNSR